MTRTLPLHLRTIFLLALGASVGLSLVPAVGIAKDRTVGISKRAVDMISQKKGPLLLGAILEQKPGRPVRIAVSREWLKASQPDLYKEKMAAERASQKGRVEKTLQRLDTWMEERADDLGLMLILKPERRRLQKLLEDAPVDAGTEAQFFILDVESNNVRTAKQQPFKQRRVAAFAWHARLQNVETRSADSLAKELVDGNVRLDGDPPNLGERLPTTDESAEDWAIRQALFEYKFRKPLDFQGTNGMLLQAGEENVDATKIVSGFFQSQLGEGLSGLLDPNGAGQTSGQQSGSNAGLEQAKAAAKKDDIRGFRITKMAHDIVGASVTVTTEFHVRYVDADTNGVKWKRVHTITKKVDASQARADSQQQIRDDPRIKQVLGLVDQLGLPSASVDTAMKFGAATREGQQAVDGQFQQFLDKYIRQVDSPPLP